MSQIVLALVTHYRTAELDISTAHNTQRFAFVKADVAFLSTDITNRFRVISLLHHLSEMMFVLMVMT